MKMIYAIQCSLYGNEEWELCQTFGGDCAQFPMPAIYFEEDDANMDLTDWKEQCPEHTYKVVGVSPEKLEGLFK